MQLYEQCFGIFDVLCQRRHGDIAETLRCLQSGTFRLHRFTARVHHSNGTGNPPKYDTLAAWFLEKLTTHPDVAATVLTECVQAILSRPALSSDSSAVEPTLGICVRYEFALWRRGRAELLRYVVDVLALQAEVGQRQNAVDFGTRMLMSEMPKQGMAAAAAGGGGGGGETAQNHALTATTATVREEALLQMLFEKMIDINNVVKMRAMSGFMRLPQEGNARVKELLQVSVYLYLLFVRLFIFPFCH